jgi:erythromycin esterase
MKEKMLFLTWRTNEVRDLLYWMCDYNLGKTESEKVQYWGIDCQFNTYHPDMVSDFLDTTDLSFNSFAEGILNQIRLASSSRFSGYNQSTFDVYLDNVDALKDSLTKYKADIVGAGSDKPYQLVLQLVNEIKELSEVVYYTQQSSSKNYRDEYMAKNTGWLHEYFDGAKIVLWAHNFHVADVATRGTMEYHLKSYFGEEYAALGFLFSKGSFMAVTQPGSGGCDSQSLEVDPKQGSINDVMSRTEVPVFTVEISDLQTHDEWRQAIEQGIKFFQMGAIYSNKSDYYFEFNADYFDRLIYFDRTTASVQLK